MSRLPRSHPILGYELSDCGHRVVRYPHDSLIPTLKSSPVFRDRIIFGLLFVVC